MWVADMNFAAPACITDAIIRRARHPAFGYFLTPDAYYDAISSWHARRKGVTDIRREYVDYQNGVLGGVSSALAAFSAPGDEILINSPTYVGFTKTLAAMGRRALHSPLVRDAEGTWRMDYDDMERKLRDHHVHVAISARRTTPAAACGSARSWSGAHRGFFERYQCVVIDEIWSDLVLPGAVRRPSRSRPGRTTTPSRSSPPARPSTSRAQAATPSPTMPAFATACACLRLKLHYNEMNVLVEALSVRRRGRALDQLLPVLNRNVDLACDCVRDRFEGVSVYRPQATHADRSPVLGEHGWTLPQLEKAGWDVGVAWQDGAAFLAPQSIRINLALPTSRVEEAFRRLDEHVFNA